MDFDSDCVGCFAGLSCDVRLKIVNLLKKKKKLDVSQIAKHFKLTQPTISHHLKYLRDMEIVASVKEGRKVFYYIHSKCAKECGIFT